MRGRWSQLRGRSARWLILPALMLNLCTQAQDKPSVIDVKVGAASGATQNMSEAAPAQATRAAQPISRPVTTPTTSRPVETRSASSLPSVPFSNLLKSLALVLGLILALCWAAKKVLRLPGAAGQQGPIQVVHRMMLAPKQHLLLIQIGQRIVLVANCGTQLNTLCEITHPDEIAALLSQTRSRVAEKPFAAWFGKARGRFEKTADDDGSLPEITEPNISATREDVSSLLEKVRLLSKAHRT